MVLLSGGCSSKSGILQGGSLQKLPWPQGITAAFNHREDRSYRSPVSGAWRNGENLEALLIETIDQAEQEVLVAVQELTLPEVAMALARQHQRGITVQLVLENNYSDAWSTPHPAELTPHQRQRQQHLRALADRDGDGQLSEEERENGDAMLILQRYGVPWLDDTADGSKGSGLMHSKYVVIDQKQVITGSANFTASGMHGDAGAPQSRGNVNHLLHLKSDALAALFREDFKQMWGDGPGGASDSRFGLGKTSRSAQRVLIGDAAVQVLFAPHKRSNPNHGLQLIASTLAKAKQQLDLALFVFSAQSLTSVIAELQQQGVELRLLADPGFASRSFSEVLDLLGVALADRDCRLEAGNKPLATASRGVGIPRLARGDKLHHKFAVIDNRTVITGSFNWSPSAAHQNDEVLLVIDSPLLAAHFTREMDRLWRTATLGITDGLRRKLDQNRSRCGSGVERG